MHALSLLERWFGSNCAFVHKARVAALLRVVGGLLLGGKATLTELGRHLDPRRYEKHGIKCADRLIGNRHLHAERLAIYRAMAHWLLRDTPRPWIVIDWSDMTLGHGQLMLKAAVPVGGRAMTLYEEVHPLRHYNSPRAHRRFLEHLHAIVPPSCCPIVITDAGFRGPWFRQVECFGWEWIGRVRNEVKYCPEGGQTWQYTRSLYYKATSKAQYLGWFWLSAKRPYGCYLHLYKALRRGPGRPRKAAHPTPHHQRARRHAREPWLLATSLSPRHWSARRVVRAYEKRMQIEETFRDLKSHRWGYGLQFARSQSRVRLENLLLITTLGTLTTWLVGLAAKTKGWMRHFQANTESHKAVLSVFTLGRRVLKSRCFRLARDDLQAAVEALTELIRTSAQHA